MAALAWACVAGFALAGPAAPLTLPAPAAPLLLLFLLSPAWPWRRPRAASSYLAALAAGALLALCAQRGGVQGCVAGDGAAVALEGHLEAPAVGGRGVFRVEGGAAPCRGALRVVLPRSVPAPAPGRRVRVEGEWRAAPAGGTGSLRIARVGDAGAATVRPLPALRGRAVSVLHRRFGARGPVAAALIVARREGLDPDLRRAFVRSGTAHLLAISGFHVGVLAALLFTLLRAGGRGASRARAAFLAALVVWAYVLAIGAPDAAVRAALVLSMAAAGVARGRPPAGDGALALAILLLALADPGAILRPGAQLSFAGAWGLVRWGPPLESWLVGWLDDPLMRRLVTPLAGPLAAGCAATLGTLPVVAWHFEQLSLVGVPATLMAGPLVALAVPGLLATLVAEALHPAAGAVVAGGVDVVLLMLIRVVEGFAELPLASIAVPRAWSLTLAAGATLAVTALRAPRVGPRVRTAVACAGALAALQLRPMALRVAESGSVEVVALDVGQGDALLVRSPKSRWILVDAGPASPGHDAGLERVLPYLRARGVARLEALVLTHADLDHIGGAASVLGGIPVGGVLDPGRARGSDAYGAALAAAAQGGVGWWEARAGAVYDLDGLRISVLYPDPAAARGEDTNAGSVVLLLQWEAFSALLTGDAPAAVEERATRDLERIDVLKVAHHGSRTSTPASSLATLRPSLALISVGSRNRFGHPHPAVVARLEAAGARVLRTDLRGTVSIVARRDGSVRIVAERGAEAGTND